eukprot:COSAG05_NODE_2215_length_3380_cov_6.954282_6_plen_103_part_00
MRAIFRRAAPRLPGLSLAPCARARTAPQTPAPPTTSSNDDDDDDDAKDDDDDAKDDDDDNDDDGNMPYAMRIPNIQSNPTAFRVLYKMCMGSSTRYQMRLVD